jgi:hypothetical protein
MAARVGEHLRLPKHEVGVAQPSKNHTKWRAPSSKLGKTFAVMALTPYKVEEKLEKARWPSGSSSACIYMHNTWLVSTDGDLVYQNSRYLYAYTLTAATHYEVSNTCIGKKVSFLY